MSDDIARAVQQTEARLAHEAAQDAYTQLAARHEEAPAAIERLQLAMQTRELSRAEVVDLFM